MRIELVVGQHADVDLGQPMQQAESGELTTVEAGPGGQRARIVAQAPGRETVVFQLEDQSRLAVEVIVG